VVVLLILLCGSVSEANACTVEITGLRKEFRRSRNVFVGKVISVASVPKEQLPPRVVETWGPLDKITFRVKQAWKGQDTGTITVFSNVYCSCPNKFLEFKEGREFLVFSDRDSIADACSLRVYDLATSDEYSKKDMKRIGSFWFRTWATLYPF
jgi:hypothetical protein